MSRFGVVDYYWIIHIYFCSHIVYLKYSLYISIVKQKQRHFIMVAHCQINQKSDIKPQEGQKRFKVEFIYRGYWAKWYAAYDVKDAIRIFKEENPEKTYCRTKRN